MQGGDAAIGWINDEGRLPGREDGRPVVEPEVVVVGRRQVLGVDAVGELLGVLLFPHSRFLVGEGFPAG